MLRLIGYFAAVFLAMTVLRQVPFLGGLFRIPLVGFFIAALLVSWIVARAAAWAVDRRRFQALASTLGAVDTPTNRGKLGALLLHQGRVARALGHLEAAAAGEPDSPEWWTLLGRARLAAGRFEQAAQALERAVALDEEFGYGTALVRLAEAYQRCGRAERALDALERHARCFGDTPEALYRRGSVLAALGRRAEARAALRRVREVARAAPPYQRREAFRWALRAWIRGLAT